MTDNSPVTGHALSATSYADRHNHGGRFFVHTGRKRYEVRQESPTPSGVVTATVANDLTLMKAQAFVQNGAAPGQTPPTQEEQGPVGVEMFSSAHPHGDPTDKLDLNEDALEQMPDHCAEDLQQRVTQLEDSVALMKACFVNIAVVLNAMTIHEEEPAAAVDRLVTAALGFAGEA